MKIQRFEYRYKWSLWNPDVEYLTWYLLSETEWYMYFEKENWEKIKIYHENLLYIKTIK
jgi:hypothetical protein